MKLIKDIDETQLFIANESNRVDQELDVLKDGVHDLNERLREVEDTMVTDQHLDHHVQLVNARLDDYYDELRDQVREIYNVKNIITGIVAGARLGSLEPSNAMALAAIQTMHSIASSINKVTERNNRLEARLDVLEFRQRPGAIIDSDINNNNSDNNNSDIE